MNPIKYLRTFLDSRAIKKQKVRDREDREYKAMVTYFRKNGLCFYCSGKGKVDYDWRIQMCTECYGTGKSK